jgi:hypothetical protein
MRFVCLIASAILVATVPVASRAEDKPKHPERSGPGFATVYRVDQAKGFLDTRFVEAQPAPGSDLGKKIYKGHLRRDAIADVKAFDGEGKKLSEKDMWDRMKEGTLVLVFWNELDPFYLAVAKKDALVLVLPSVGASIGPVQK